jgi:hypothetical protein
MEGRTFYVAMYKQRRIYAKAGLNNFPHHPLVCGQQDFEGCAAGGISVCADFAIHHGDDLLDDG